MIFCSDMFLHRRCGKCMRTCRSKLFLGTFLCAAVLYILILQSSISSQPQCLVKQRREFLKIGEQYLKQLVEQQVVQGHSLMQPVNATIFPAGMQEIFSEYFHERLRSDVAALEEKVESLEKRLNKEIPFRLDSNSAECSFVSFEGFGYCEERIKWTRKMWKSDSCYAEWGVDGSDCSIMKYLSEVEHVCPPLTAENATNNSDTTDEFEDAIVRSSLSGLYSLLHEDKHYKWIKMRIQRMESMWLFAAEMFKRDYKLTHRKKKILIHTGLLADEKHWGFAAGAWKGGPLGELVQWSDVITSVYLLGHDISLTTSSAELKRDFDPYITSASENCPLKETPFDAIYIDICGLDMLKKVAGKKFHLLRCKFRVVDTFGTEPEFNDARYADRHNLAKVFGKWDLVPMQFNTMFPHTPDNTFLGFVIEQHLDDNATQGISKANISLVYGKKDEFWQGKQTYLDTIHEFTEVHGTTAGSSHVPSYVVNHGVLPGKELHALLRKAKIFVGMGFPYEGPAPLEAIANGGVFLNPIISQSSEAAKNVDIFFKDKPTKRRLSSQHPYAETFIGPPHVRMVDMENTDAVKTIVRDILSSPSVTPYVPYEFTCVGMLTRLAYQIEKQEFCAEISKPVWPPLSALQAIVSNNVQACNDVCLAHGLVCEPSFFTQLNRKSAFDKLGIKCNQYLVPNGPDEAIDYPSHMDGRCYLQSNSQLFSCAGRTTDTHRLCPCRDFLKGQVALCADCLL